LICASLEARRPREPSSRAPREARQRRTSLRAEWEREGDREADSGTSLHLSSSPCVYGNAKKRYNSLSQSGAPANENGERARRWPGRCFCEFADLLAFRILRLGNLDLWSAHLLRRWMYHGLHSSRVSVSLRDLRRERRSNSRSPIRLKWSSGACRQSYMLTQSLFEFVV